MFCGGWDGWSEGVLGGCSDFNCRIDDLAIIKGTALRTGNFAIPTSPLKNLGDYSVVFVYPGNQAA